MGSSISDSIPSEAGCGHSDPARHFRINKSYVMIFAKKLFWVNGFLPAVSFLTARKLPAGRWGPGAFAGLSRKSPLGSQTSGGEARLSDPRRGFEFPIRGIGLVAPQFTGQDHPEDSRKFQGFHAGFREFAEFFRCSSVRPQDFRGPVHGLQELVAFAGSGRGLNGRSPERARSLRDRKGVSDDRRWVGVRCRGAHSVMGEPGRRRMGRAVKYFTAVGGGRVKTRLAPRRIGELES